MSRKARDGRPQHGTAAPNAQMTFASLDGPLTASAWVGRVTTPVSSELDTELDATIREHTGSLKSRGRTGGAWMIYASAWPDVREHLVARGWRIEDTDGST